MESDFKYKCSICKDSGNITAVRNGTHDIYTFRCGVCSMAERKKLSLLMPIWSSHYKEKYENYSEYLARQGWKT